MLKQREDSFYYGTRKEGESVDLWQKRINETSGGKEVGKWWLWHGPDEGLIRIWSVLWTPRNEPGYMAVGTFRTETEAYAGLQHLARLWETDDNDFKVRTHVTNRRFYQRQADFGLDSLEKPRAPS